MAYGAETILEVQEILTLIEVLEMNSDKYGISREVVTGIIKCESNFIATALGTDAMIGVDVGLWQINDYFWRDYLLEKGWDINNPDDNIEAGFYLLKTYGVKLWSASEGCHGYK